MALSKIDTNAIADDAVDNTKLDLASNYAFTGTVTGAGENNTPLFIARKNGDHTGISSGTWTKITGWTEIADPDSKFDTSTARFTPAVAGKYLVQLNCWIGTEANQTQYLAIYKTGTAAEKSAVNTGGDANHPFQVSAIVDLNTTDYVEPYVYFNGTHTKTVYSEGVTNQFSAFLIST